MGPTAGGKTDVGLEAARRSGATVVSVDSMQVYRGMDIGTAKPTPEQRRLVPHLMIDVVDPWSDYTAAEFQSAARAAVAEVDGPVLVVGGSGLHFRSLVDPLEFPPTDPEVRAALERESGDVIVEELLAADPRAGSVVDLANPRRVTRAVEILRLTGATPSERAARAEAEQVRTYHSRYRLTVFGLDPGPVLEERAAVRIHGMQQAGLLAEVEALSSKLGRSASQAVGYRELLEVVAGRVGIEEGFAAVRRSTWRLVKRQRTFFARDPRIRWMPTDDREQMVRQVVAALTEGAR